MTFDICELCFCYARVIRCLKGSHRDSLIEKIVESQKTSIKSITEPGCQVMMDAVMALLLEKTTKKNSKNSSIPPSQTGKDETKIQPPRKKSDTSKENESKAGSNVETVTIEEVSSVENCGNCGSDLSDIDPSAREDACSARPDYVHLS